MEVAVAVAEVEVRAEVAGRGRESNRNQICADRGRQLSLSPFNGIYQAQLAREK